MAAAPLIETDGEAALALAAGVASLADLRRALKALRPSR